MFKKSSWMILAAILAVSALFAPMAVFAAGHTPVTICHATNSESNPYVRITVDDDAVDGQGNADHNSDQHQDGRDIIPPGSWDADGRNWDATGQAIWADGCNVPTATPTSTSTSVPPTETNTPTTPEPTATSPEASATATNTPAPTNTTDPCGDHEGDVCATPTNTPEPTQTDVVSPTATNTNPPASSPTPTSTSVVPPVQGCTAPLKYRGGAYDENGNPLSSVKMRFVYNDGNYQDGETLKDGFTPYYELANGQQVVKVEMVTGYEVVAVADALPNGGSFCGNDIRVVVRPKAQSTQPVNAGGGGGGGGGKPTDGGDVLVAVLAVIVIVVLLGGGYWWFFVRKP